MRKYIDILENAVNEIEMSHPQEFPLSDFEHNFDTAETVWTDPNDDTKSIRWVRSPWKTRRTIRQEMLGLFHGNNLTALLVVEPYYRNPSVSQINITTVAPEERGKGYMRLLITYYRNNFGQICSDGINSPDAQTMWKSLIARPGGLKISVWNAETGDKRPAKGLPDSEIWNDEEGTVLLVEAVDIQSYGFGENILEEKLQYPHHRRWGEADKLNP